MPLPATAQYHLDHSEGYLELVMLEDARNELDKIAPAYQSDRDVRHVRLAIATEAKDWTEAARVSRLLTEAEPNNPDWIVDLAYAMRRAESLEAAHVILSDAVKRFPKSGMIQFNLGCYEAQLGNVEVAKRHVARAIEINGMFRKMALEDEDLVGVRGHISALECGQRIE